MEQGGGGDQAISYVFLVVWRGRNTTSTSSGRILKDECGQDMLSVIGPHILLVLPLSNMYEVLARCQEIYVYIYYIT